MVDQPKNWGDPNNMYLSNGLRIKDGETQFQCRVCGEWVEFPDDPESYDEDAHENMCGGSPRCCP